MNNEEELQDLLWDNAYKYLVSLFGRFGTENAFGRGDFWVVDDNYGGNQNTVCIFNLAILTPLVVERVHEFLQSLPDWEIILVVDVEAGEGKWPAMGVIVRKHEIIDELQREYLPPPYNQLEFPGSRRRNGRI